MEPSKSLDTSPPAALPWRARLTAAFGVLVVLGALLWVLGRFLGGDEAGSPPIFRPRPDDVPPAAVVVDAVPWGQIRTLVGPDGLLLPLPEDPSTPLVLELAPGHYRIELEGPTGEDRRSCEVELSAGGDGRCRIAFVELEPVDYFREAGWWN
ncbi:MAG: hypothetical protein KDD47_22945 [Acidobacteria bacterium]|nr:hypothetical protein [Acidobacteriota bacterium]